MSRRRNNDASSKIYMCIDIDKSAQGSAAQGSARSTRYNDDSGTIHMCIDIEKLAEG